MNTNDVSNAITKEDLNAQLEFMSKRVLDPKVGLYGPGSMAWEIHKQTSVLFGAGAANLLQLAHPWVSQAIDQHSETQNDPLGRLRRTFLNVHSMVFGSLDQVLDSAVKVHNIHAAITGEVSETTGRVEKGSSYVANQVDAMLWVHATLWVIGLEVYELFHKPLTKAQRDQYYEESKLFAYLFGVPDDAIPETWEDFIQYFDDTVASDQLAVGDVGKQLVSFIFHMNPVLRPFLARHEIHTAVLLPPRLQVAFGLPDVTPKVQAKFDFDVKMLKSIFNHAPDSVRFLPPYLEAEQRIKGSSAKWYTKLTNQVVYGQSHLVS
ncbi:MAG: DUF2236 domain-containing protein [Pseudomonadales bacterium]|nr:DUF2236 domain-containing protein [Pseudomonadales bacterium]